MPWRWLTCPAFFVNGVGVGGDPGGRGRGGWGGGDDGSPLSVTTSWVGQQPRIMVSAHQHLDTFLSWLWPSRSCCRNWRRGGEEDGEVPEAVSTFPPQNPPGFNTELVGGNVKGPRLATARQKKRSRLLWMWRYVWPRLNRIKEHQLKWWTDEKWSPGIYRALRLVGKSLDIAWERVFICSLTFN